MSCPPPNPPPVVIDNGSWRMKCGFAGDKSPRVETPPNGAIQEGSVVNWDAATELWREIFVKLNTSPDKQPVLLTEAALVSKADREKMAEVFFESLNTHSIYLASQPILSLYASGRLDGIALEMGYGVTQVVPAHKGNPVAGTGQRCSIAGQKLDQSMRQLLEEQNITGLSEDTVRDIKEKLGYVALNFDTEEQQWESVKKIYKLPDGKEVFIGKPRFACPEVLFQPTESFPGVHSLLNEGISKIAAATNESASTFSNNIVVTGGSSLFPGVVERLEKEIRALLPSGTPLSVTAGSGTTSAFIGGSILTCLAQMNPLWVTKQMYNESGVAIVHEKCF